MSVKYLMHEFHEKKSVVFEKGIIFNYLYILGDLGDKFYIILRGSVGIYERNKN